MRILVQFERGYKKYSFRIDPERGDYLKEGDVLKLSNYETNIKVLQVINDEVITYKTDSGRLAALATGNIEYFIVGEWRPSYQAYVKKEIHSIHEFLSFIDKQESKERKETAVERAIERFDFTPYERYEICNLIIPKNILSAMFYYQVKQGNEFNPYVFADYILDEEKGFNWDLTEEGAEFWHKVLVENNFNDIPSSIDDKVLTEELYLQFQKNNNNLNEINNSNNSNNDKKEKTMKKNNMISTMMEKFKSLYFPQIDKNLKITMDGQIAVTTKDGYVSIVNGELTSYVKEMVLDIPGLFTISKPFTQIKEGDIVKHNGSYVKVLNIVYTKTKTPTIKSLNCISYTGSGRSVFGVKDFLLGQATIPVVVNIMSGLEGNGSINPMMMMMLNTEENENESSLMETLMMMSMMQSMGNNNTGVNPMANMFNNPMMMMMFMDKKEGFSNMFETMMMMQMMSGGMNFENMFSPNNIENGK